MLDSIRKWVAEQGYPLEMLTAKAFRDGGFEVRQSEVYFDRESQKSHEIDVFAIAPDVIGLTKIVFTVECKSSKKPWILFASRHATEGTSRFFTYAVMSQSSIELLSEITSNDPANSTDPIHIDLFDRLKWMRKPGIIGYSLRQAFSEVDNAYAALTSAMRAARHLIDKETQGKVPFFQIAFPIVVVDAPLVICSLDDAGELQLSQVDVAEVIFTAPDQERITTCIRIVTIKHLREFVVEAGLEVNQIRAEFNLKERIVWAELFQSEYPELIRE